MQVSHYFRGAILLRAAALFQLLNYIYSTSYDPSWTSNPILTLKYSYNIQRIPSSDPLIGTRKKKELQQSDARIQPTEWWTQRECFQLLIQCELKRFNSGLCENGSRFSVVGLSRPPSLQTEVSSADCLCFQHLVVKQGHCVPHCFYLPLLWAPRFWVWVGWALDCKSPLTPVIQHRSDGLIYGCISIISIFHYMKLM